MSGAPDIFLSYNRKDQARASGRNGPVVAVAGIVAKRQSRSTWVF